MGFHKNLSGTDLHPPQGKSPTPLQLDDDTSAAYLIEDTSNLNYLRVDTTDSAEVVKVGNTTTNPKLVQEGSGNVGLGTASPTEKVDVSITGTNGGIRVKNATDNAYLKLDAPTDEAAYIDFSTAENNDWQIGRRPNSNDLTVYDNDGANNYIFVWQQGGNVGIGTLTPSTKLHVDGDVTVNGTISGVATPSASTDAANKAYVDSTSSGISAVVDDTSPQLGGNLDCNGNNIILDHDNSILDENTKAQITFITTASALNSLGIRNAASGGDAQAGTTSTAPTIESVGETNVDLGLAAKGTGTVTIRANTNSGTLSLNSTGNTKTINITVPTTDSLGSSYTLTLPPDDGNANDVLQSDGSGGLSWVPQSGGGLTVESKNADATLTGTNKFIKANSGGGAITLTLPAASTAGSGAIFVIKDIGNASSNAITLEGNGSETIDGALNKIISTNFASIEVVCDGSNWFIR